MSFREKVFGFSKQPPKVGQLCAVGERRSVVGWGAAERNRLLQWGGEEERQVHPLFLVVDRRYALGHEMN